MLRIDTREEDGFTSLTIEGKLVGRWVQELEQCWHAIVSSQESGHGSGQLRRSIRVNLSAVGFIDSKGKDLLLRMRKQGAVLVPTGCFMKVIVDEIESEVSKG
jgi:hypothetical protein